MASTATAPRKARRPRRSNRPRPTQHANLAELWLALGKVPLRRIVLHPAPGTATERDVLRLDDHHDRICELVNGTLIEKALGTYESLVAMQIGAVLVQFVGANKLGIVLGEAGMLRILPGQVRIPDVSFISTERLPGGQLPDQPIAQLVPDLAVEVISPGNSKTEMTLKLTEYFRAGVRAVWYVYPKTRTVEIYASPTERRTLKAKDTLDAAPLLPGLSFPVADIFAR